MFLDFKENKIIARSVNIEKNNLALKIIPELINSDPRLGISGSFIKLNQIFEKKNAINYGNHHGRVQQMDYFIHLPYLQM